MLACAAGGRDKGASELRRPAPFSLHPIPRHAWRWEILGSGVELDIVPWREGETRLSVPTPNFQLTTNP